MALRNKVYDKNHGEDERPVVRPDLGASENSNNHQFINNNQQSINNRDYNQSSGGQDMSSAYAKGGGSDDGSISRRSEHGGSTNHNSAEEKRMNLDQIKKAEEETENGDKNSDLEAGSKEQQWLTRLAIKKGDKKSGKGKKAGLIAGAGGLSGLFILAAVVLFLLGALKIPHFMENVTSWQMTRTSRAWARSTGAINNERFWLNNVDETRFNSLKERYSGLRSNTWGKLDKYRPAQVIKNMSGEGKLKYNYGPPEGALRRQPLVSITVDGEEIAVPRKSKLHPFQSRNERLRFNAKLDTKLEEALSEHRSLVRSKVANNIRDKIGFKKLRWWQKKASAYKGATPVEADHIELKDSYDNAEGKADSTKSDIAEVDNKSDDLSEEMKKNVDDPAKAKNIIDSGGQPPDEVKSGLQSFAESVDNSWAKNAISSASLIVGVGSPICMVYSGSVENSGPLIDEQTEIVQRQYYQGATAADQLKAGDTTAEAAGALSKKLGKMSDSVAMNRASGRTGSDLVSGQAGPQASGAGTYTIIDTLFGDNLLTSAIIGAADTICPYLTDMKIGATVAAGELAVSGLSCFATIPPGAGCAALESAEAGAKVTVGRVIRGLVTQVVSRKTAKRVLFEGAAVAGITFLAKYYVTQHMFSEFSGTSMNQEFANQVDMGGNMHANELNRQMMYGRPMTNGEVAYDMSENRQYLAEKKQDRSVFDRYFALSRYDSLASTMGMSIISKPNIGTSFLSTLSPVTTLGSVGKVAGGLLGGNAKVYAEDEENANEENYNIVQWGWSQEETDLMENDETYFMLENDYILESSGNLAKIEEKFGECYSNTLGQLLSGDGDSPKILRNEDGSINESADALCSPKKLGTENDEFGDNMVFRWRLSKMYANTVEHLDGLQNPTESNESDSGTSNPNLYMIGDSISVMLRDGVKIVDMFKANGWTDVCLEAQGSRPLVGTASMAPFISVAAPAIDCSGKTGVEKFYGMKQIDQPLDTEKIKKAGVVVIALGTNDGPNAGDTFKQSASEMIDKIKSLNSSAQIYWVNMFTAPFAPSNYSPASMETNNAILQELSTQKSISIIDWHSLASANPDFYAGSSQDGVHPTEGIDDLARLIVDGVGKPKVSASGLSGGVQCPSVMEEHPSHPGYFKMPDAPNGEYHIYSVPARRYGSKQLVCVLYTVGLAYEKAMGGRSRLDIGDLNAADHQSHYKGIAVDLDGKGELAAADSTGNRGGTYSTEATTTLGKLFIDTGVMQDLWWCDSGDGSLNAIIEYANSKGTPLKGAKCISGHYNHFHFNIKQEYALPGSWTP